MSWEKDKSDGLETFALLISMTPCQKTVLILVKEQQMLFVSMSCSPAQVHSSSAFPPRPAQDRKLPWQPAAEAKSLAGCAPVYHTVVWLKQSQSCFQILALTSFPIRPPCAHRSTLWEAVSFSSRLSRWADKTAMLCLHDGILLSRKKKKRKRKFYPLR